MRGRQTREQHRLLSLAWHKGWEKRLERQIWIVQNCIEHLTDCLHLIPFCNMIFRNGPWTVISVNTVYQLPADLKKKMKLIASASLDSSTFYRKRAASDVQWYWCQSNSARCVTRFLSFSLSRILVQSMYYNFGVFFLPSSSVYFAQCSKEESITWHC